MKPCGGSSLTLTRQRVFSKLHLRKMTLLPFKASVVFLRCWTVKTNFNCWCLLYRSAASSARWTAPSWRHWSRWECTESTTFFMLRCKQALNCRAWKHVYSFVSRWGHENIKQDSSDSFSPMTFLKLTCSLFAECRCSTTRRCVRTVIITPAAPDVCSAWVSAPHTSVTHRSRISDISGESNQHSLFSTLYFSEANILLLTPPHLSDSCSFITYHLQMCRCWMFVANWRMNCCFMLRKSSSLLTRSDIFNRNFKYKYVVLQIILPQVDAASKQTSCFIS